MFLVSFGKKTKRVFLAVFCVALMAAVAVTVVWLCDAKSTAGKTGFPFDLQSCGGVAGFLGSYSLEPEGTETVREVTLPSKDDANFKAYGDVLSRLGMDILEFSGKRVEERYLKLKNKNEKGKTLYAVLYIYKEKVIGGYLTTLEQGSGYLALGSL